MLPLVPEMNQFICIVFSSFLLHMCFALNADIEDGKYSKDLSAIETDETDEVLSLAGILTIDEIISSEPVGCGNYVLNSGESVVFQSPNFPDKYPKDYKCAWRFTCPSENAAMEVKCDRFELEANRICYTDYLEIFNNYKSLGKYCGKDSPTGLISNSNYMKAIFHSNWDRITRAGFRCSVKCINKQIREINLDDDKNGPTSVPPTVPCGSYVMDPDDSVIIRSKNFPKSYPKNQKCTWRFTCSSSNAEMRLHCDSFALQKTRVCNADYLEIFNSFHSLGKHCGKKGPKYLHNNSNYMKVNFRSNGDRITRTGFHCILKCKEKMDKTSLTFLKKRPELSTLNKELALMHNLGLIFSHIERNQPSNEREFPDSVLKDLADNSQHILSDDSDLVLPILEPNNLLETIINKLAEYPKIEEVISYFEENEVDPVLEWIGQIASKVHSSQVANAVAVECGSHMINPGDKMYFQSPNYPNKYPRKYECVWEFNCPRENTIMEMNCDDHFELQKNPICYTDYIETFDKSGSIRRNCGKDAPKALISNTNFMRVVFKTNWDKIRRAGFSCNVICMENEVGPGLKWIGQLASKLHSSQVEKTAAVECGSHLINPGDELYFQSPNYPNKYPKNYKCVWKINCAWENAIMEMNCDDHFELQKNQICYTDYIETFDKSGSIKKNCGKDAPKALISNTNFMKVVFKTNSDKIRRAGFSCNVKCNGITTTTTKPIEKPLPTTTTKTPLPPTTTNPPTTTTSKTTNGSKNTTTNIPTTTLSPPLPCGKYIIEPSETVYFESQNYPDKYKKNDTCRWRFTCSAMSSLIEVDCPDFNVESDPDCAKDYLKVKDEDSKLGTYCGKNGPSNLVSYSNIMKIYFVSDHENKRSGFRCSVRCTYIETSSVSTFGYENITIEA